MNQKEIRFFAKKELVEKRSVICSQQEIVGLIAAETGKRYSRTFYTHIEKGTRGVSGQIALVIARILATPVDELFTKEKE